MANGTAPNEAAPSPSLARPMGVPRRPRRVVRTVAIIAGLTIVAGAIGWVAAGGIFEATALGPAATGGPNGPGGSGSGGLASPTPLPTPTPQPPIGGTELYGYLPYWQMTDAIAAYLDRVPVSTLALFSVSANTNGALRKTEIGYRRITSDLGNRLISDAHARRQRVELVFTSFGATQNARLFALDDAGLARRARAARELLALASDLGVDGINVDVESVDGDVTEAYASFLLELRNGLTAMDPQATLSVATTSGPQGALLARTAVGVGVDRVFLMGYDYHWSGSLPGASSPIHNRDPGLDLMQSIVNYVELGIPRDRILLGLPLYGMSWRVAGPDRAFSVVGKGQTWIPARNLDVLSAADFRPTLDPDEVVESFIVEDGDAWRATFYDSPRTLRTKLELARSQGLAGSGFWALGYEYGVPGYVELMRDFRAGKVGG